MNSYFMASPGSHRSIQKVELSHEHVVGLQAPEKSFKDHFLQKIYTPGWGNNQMILTVETMTIKISSLGKKQLGASLGSCSTCKREYLKEEIGKEGNSHAFNIFCIRCCGIESNIYI